VWHGEDLSKSFQDEHDLDLTNNEIVNINKSLSFILLEGESLRVENTDLRDNDFTSTDDTFSYAKQDHDFAIADGSHTITSVGENANDGDDEIGAELVTSYTLKVES
jgi:hypothetical protein